MPKQGEIDYYKNTDEGTMIHAINKPFSDRFCGLLLMQIGAIIHLLPNPPATLLDFGCGTGWTSCFFAQRGYNVLGQDICGDAIECANNLKNKIGLPNLNFICSDYENLEIKNQFDCAVFIDSLHHSMDEEKALLSAYNSLKDGGILITAEPGFLHSKTKGSIRVMKEFGVTEKDMQPNKIIKIGKKIGFKKFRVYPNMTDLGAFVYSYNHPVNLFNKFFKFTFKNTFGGITILVK